MQLIIVKTPKDCKFDAEKHKQQGQSGREAIECSSRQVRNRIVTDVSSEQDDGERRYENMRQTAS